MVPETPGASSQPTIREKKIIECGAAGGIIQLNNGSQIGWCRGLSVVVTPPRLHKNKKNKNDSNTHGLLSHAQKIISGQQN